MSSGPAAAMVNNDGCHGMQWRHASVELTLGSHFIELLWYAKGGGAGLELRCKSPGVGEEIHIPSNVMCQPLPLQAIDATCDAGYQCEPAFLPQW